MDKCQIKQYIIEGIKKNVRLKNFLNARNILREFINNCANHIMTVIDKYPTYVNIREIILNDFQSAAIIGLAFQWENTKEKYEFWKTINTQYYLKLQP